MHVIFLENNKTMRMKKKDVIRVTSEPGKRIEVCCEIQPNQTK